ncbi:BNR repeat-containing protein [Halosimplex aquaticum]|uniref:BNR repeat-containing protein n=1 Tax=Halosimplex aquaticum TaxID=3026162 RepID=A0ABD5Y0V8_9EURY|nr:BNR repeat-containing protein [Halosimplex aquaticum]
MRPPRERSVETVLDVDEVWAGHPVGFDLLTVENRQFVAYYDAERWLTVAQRDLDEEEWTQTALDERVEWDSHNDIAMSVDAAGHLHVSGNMHVDPLVYFRSTEPLDATTLERVDALVGRDEDAVTYPTFLDGPDGDLVFMYRDGGSGDGRRLLNAYDPEAETWRRLLDEPLLDGRGEMNAYPTGPLRGPDGDYHLAWVWRDTPDAATNHDLSYARSPDLVDWERADGRALDLPITVDDGAVVDPVPAGDGLLNSNVAVSFDAEGRPVLSYHRHDADGNTQVYDARFDGAADEWTVSQVSDWDYRWAFGGHGTLDDEILVDPVRVVDDRLVQTFWHAEYGPGRWILDPETLAVERTDAPWHGLPEELGQPTTGGHEVQWAADAAKPPDSETGDNNDDTRTYALRWETLPANRDRARGGAPEPTTLRLYAFE